MTEFIKQTEYERELNKKMLDCLEKSIENNKYIVANNNKMLIFTSIISALVCIFITCTFIFCYFFGDYSYTTTTTNINENTNINKNTNEGRDN